MAQGTMREEGGPVVVRHPELMSGEPVFRGTRVTLATVFDHLAAGLSLEEILESWPTLRREDVVAVLREAHNHIADHAA